MASHVRLDPDHNGQVSPAGRKLQPLRNVDVIIFPWSCEKDGHFDSGAVMEEKHEGKWALVVRRRVMDDYEAVQLSFA